MCLKMFFTETTTLVIYFHRSYDDQPVDIGVHVLNKNVDFAHDFARENDVGMCGNGVNGHSEMTGRGNDQSNAVFALIWQ